MKLGILGSTRGTNLLAIMAAIETKRLSANIELVLSNKSDAIILKHAASFGLPSVYLDPTGLSREAYDRAVSAKLIEYAVEVIVLIGYMRILSAEFVSLWESKIINVHPSLLPAHAGKMDLDVHRSVLTQGDKESGCTVHFVTQEVDAGPIILQKKCRVIESDTAESLKKKVQELEGEALVEAIRILAGT